MIQSLTTEQHYGKVICGLMQNNQFDHVTRVLDVETKDKDSRAAFCEYASKRLVEKHPDLIAEIKIQATERRRDKVFLITRICRDIFDMIGDYFQEIRLAWQLTSSNETRQLGWDITLLKTFGYTPFLVSLVTSTAFVAGAIALPFLSTGIAGMSSVHLIVGAVIDLSLGTMQKIYMDLLWEKELREFETFADKDGLQLFIARELEQGLTNLRGKVEETVFTELEKALAYL